MAAQPNPTIRRTLPVAFAAVCALMAGCDNFYTFITRIEAAKLAMQAALMGDRPFVSGNSICAVTSKFKLARTERQVERVPSHLADDVNDFKVLIEDCVADLECAAVSLRQVSGQLPSLISWEFSEEDAPNEEPLGANERAYCFAAQDAGKYGPPAEEEKDEPPADGPPAAETVEPAADETVEQSADGPPAAETVEPAADETVEQSADEEQPDEEQADPIASPVEEGVTQATVKEEVKKPKVETAEIQTQTDEPWEDDEELGKEVVQRKPVVKGATEEPSEVIQ